MLKDPNQNNNVSPQFNIPLVNSRGNINYTSLGLDCVVRRVILMESLMKCVPAKTKQKVPRQLEKATLQLL
jgi:hypothetical protein